MRVLITAGPTREYLDPVRFLTNASSGEMGIQLARAFQKRGARVTLVLGPTSLPRPKKVKVLPVITALQMHSAVRKNISRADVFVAAAAVGDWRFAKVSPRKLKKSGVMKLSLVKNPDLLAEAGARKKKAGRGPLLIGFALETDHLEKNAANKLKEKNLDLIIGNGTESFSSGNIRALWLEKSGVKKRLARMSKKTLAEKITVWRYVMHDDQLKEIAAELKIHLEDHEGEVVYFGLPIADFGFKDEIHIPQIQNQKSKIENGKVAALDELRVQKIGDCHRCPLGDTRNKIVFGVGNPEARVMFIGEGPGFDEDRQGEPFVGKAGQLLDKIMAAIGLDRTSVYIANIVKCHPMKDAAQPELHGDDRPPSPEEMAECLPFLKEQIRSFALKSS